MTRHQIRMCSCWRRRSSSLIAKIMLFSNTSMLCMMLVQGFKTSSDESSVTPSSAPSSGHDAAGSNNNNNKPDYSFLNSERGRQVFLATNTLPSANRFLQSASIPNNGEEGLSSPRPAASRTTTTPAASAAVTFRPSTSAEHKLYETLFKRSLYQKNVRPVQNHLRSIKVRLGVCVMTIDEIIEKDQTMITSGCIKMKWSDEFLQWSPEAFQNLTWLVMPSTEIWLPDIALVNSPDPYTITRKPAFAEVTNTGQVGYYPSGRFSTRCAISLLFFPFDIQKCELRFESWVYPTQWLHIEPWEQNPIDMKDFYRNHQWDLERVSAIPGNISYDGLDFSTMRFIFYFRRRSLYYSVLSIFPGVLMSILQMFSHTLPVEHPARMTLLTSLFVSASVLQSSLASQMPKSSDGISLIQMYLMIFSSNLIISMVVTFVNMHVWFRVPLAEVPNALRMLRSFLLDTGGTTGRPMDKPQSMIGPPPSAPPPTTASPSPGAGAQSSSTIASEKMKSQLGASASRESLTTKSGKSAGGSRGLGGSSREISHINEVAQEGEGGSSQGRFSTKGEQTDEETSSLIVSYCCGAVRHRTNRRGRDSTLYLRRRTFLTSKSTPKNAESVPSKGGDKASASTGAATAAAGDNNTINNDDASTKAGGTPTKKAPLLSVVQTVQSQVSDRKERWLRFSMKVDKAFLYAMAIFNTICPITIFLIVPQFQTYNDGES